MILYNLTLQPPTSITATIVGHFSGEKHQELVVARHQWLEVWRPDTATGKISIEHSEHMFCKIRSIAAFRLGGGGGAKDYVVLASDSGAMTMLEYEAGNQGGRRRFRQAQSHEFGRSGLRRLMAGQYVAADPGGRALMVAGVERAKLVYIVTRDSSNGGLAIASPLVASRAHTVCFALAAVDVGYENPVFAAIEGVYGGRAGAKVLAYYEVELGLNHVVRKWTADVSDSANHLIALPGGAGGGEGGAPSGVLVCSAGQIEFRHAGCAACAAAIPRRQRSAEDEDEDQIPIIVASAVHRTKATTFVLAQSDAGDLFRVAVETDEGLAVRRVRIAYFDTLAAPAGSLAILRAGFLFAATRDGGGSHQLLQFENLGEDGEEGDSSEETLRFARHAEMASLAAVDEIDSIAPLVAAQTHDLAGEGAPQIYAAGGRGSAASAALRIVRHGAEVADLAAAELPAAPAGVWTVAGGGAERIVVSLAAATLVLELRDDGEVAEAPDAAGLACDAPTLAAASAADGSGTVQVTPAAVRHVLRDGRVREWRPPGARAISCAAASAHAAVVALALGGRAVWLELHAATGALREAATIDTQGAGITCVALAPPAAGRARAAFVAVGCGDCAVRVFALDGGGGARLAGVVATAAEPEAVACLAAGAEVAVFCGLRNGMLVRTDVDAATGAVLASRVRVVGAGAVRLACARVGGAPAVVAMPADAPPWLAAAPRSSSGRPQRLVPLAYDALDHAAALAPSPLLPDGALAAVAGATLRIVAPARPEAAAVCVATIPLGATPRALALHPESRHFAVIETERAAGAWASRVRVVNPLDGATTDSFALPRDEAAVSLALVRFAADPAGRLLLAVGCARAMTLRPRACAAACVRLFCWRDGATRLELVHETAVADVPLALAPFAGMLLVALGRAVRLFDLGARRLLLKAQALVAPTAVCQLRAHPTALRVFVADAQESVRLVVYGAAARTFRTVVDDSLPRYVTAMHVLDDGDTVVAGDKFGNVVALRVPPAALRALDADSPAPTLATGSASAPFRWDVVAHYHVGDIATALTTAALVPGARPVILVATLLGSLGAAIPLLSRSDADTLRALERSIRDRAPPVSGRDHAAFRSALAPARAAIDGDLCERFFLLDADVRQSIADDVGRSVPDILKKLDDMRSLFAF
ncbi:pre-mRNA-splicing factor rse1 [Coemansia sp. BCRC 34490]|nr:pre-mRNA-splicing factor rse1 [Coemansia sp. BCRC 34490]